MTRFTLVAGDFVRTGGMDVANFNLARHLASAHEEVHLVAHRVDPSLLAIHGVVWHRVPKPLNSYLLADPLLARAGSRWGRRGAAAGGQLVANGGNCVSDDANWVHYVHAAYEPKGAASIGGQLLDASKRRHFVAAERRAVRQAQLVIANSKRTAEDLTTWVGIPPNRIRTVYYGTDATYHRPPDAIERTAARAMLEWRDERPGVVFVGALGDRRKGFDLVFAAWEMLCRDAAWDARLVVAGTGRELPMWRARATAAGLDAHIRFLGFTRDVRTAMWASDVIVAPSRYEAYGLAVHEAVCCGLPAITSPRAGVIERLNGLDPLQPERADDPEALVSALHRWRNRTEDWAQRALALSRELRAWTWDDMAGRIVHLMTER